MSFIDDIIDVGRSAAGWLGGSGLGPNLARTALTGLALNQISKAINRENSTADQPDPGIRFKLDPNPENRIPVLYGRAVTGGIITDAQLVNDNRTMYFCLTIAEKTGTKVSDSAASSYTFRDVYWNNERVVFQTDGITVDYTVDNTGEQNTDIQGLVKIYLYAGNSETGTTIPIYTNTTPNAYTVMPTWTSNHMMNDLIFAIIRVDYNSEKKVNGLPQIEFDIENSMTLPGDCLYDMMTNTRYGAGIDSSEIYVS